MTALAENRSALVETKQRAVISEMDHSINQGRPFTLSTLANKVRIHPKTFIAALHEAAQSDTHHMHEFALDVFERWGRQQETLMHKAYVAADSKERWEGFVTMLERMYREDWVKPSEAAHLQPQVNIGMVEQLAIVNGGNQSALPTSD